MKFSRARLAFALLLGGAGLFLTWQVSGQQGPAVVEVNTLPFSENLLYGVGRPRDPELEKLIRAEATAAREVGKLMAEYGKAEKEEELAEV